MADEAKTAGAVPAVETQVRRIQGRATFWPGWFKKNFGLEALDPMQTSARLLIEQGMQRQRLLHRRYPDLPLGSADPKPSRTVDWPSANRLLPNCYGSPEMHWDDETGCWWHDRDNCPWAWVKSPADILSIKPANWEAVPEVEGLFRRIEETQAIFPGETIEVPHLPWIWRHPNSKKVYRFWSYTTLIDQAPFMVGMERFLKMCAVEPDMGQALFEKNFEVVVDFENYLRGRRGNPPTDGINCQVGTCGALHSRRTYEKYSLAYDHMVLDHFGRDIPSNLHSCGASSHLYDYWSQFPGVVLMQTRAIVGQTARLRRNVPNTYIELTIHPPQFDFEQETPEHVREVVWKLAEEVGFRDVDMRVLIAGTGDEEIIERNLRAFYAVIDEINACLAAGFEKTMQLFLFLDDWMLDGYHDLVRRFPRPVPAAPGSWPGPHFHFSAAYDPAAGAYRCWYFRPAPVDASLITDFHDVPWLFCVGESAEGFHWQPLDHGGPADPRFPDCHESIAWPTRPNGDGQMQPRVVFRDEHDPDPSRRYKTVDYQGWLAFSPDGITWHVEPAGRAFAVTGHSDTKNNIYYNPLSDRYQVHHRPMHVDRRIALSDSTDLLHWDHRGVVFQTDAQDPPLLQVYSMMAYWYEDLFIAFPDLFRVSHSETDRRYKMRGHDEVGLAYSYNGTCWLRPYREPFLGLGEPGSLFGGIHAPGDMLVGADDVLRIYTCGLKVPHDDGTLQLECLRRGEEYEGIGLYTLRKDGFACLEPLGGWGWLRTHVLLPQAGDLRINVQVPAGQMLCQITDEAGQALPGFSFEECQPFRGEGLEVRPQWGERNLDELVGRPCRLEIKLLAGRLYAFRWQCQLCYTKTPLEHV